jgi:hypothetical protein
MKGKIMDYVSGDPQSSHHHAAFMVKNGPAYELYYARYTDMYICRGVLAMSQPGATGSSLTGVYTNANPQVNLGFKSTDSVVLFYERKAVQNVTSARQSGSRVMIEPKEAFYARTLDFTRWTSFLGEISDGVKGTQWLQVMLQNNWVSGNLDVMSTAKLQKLEEVYGANIFSVDISEIFTRKEYFRDLNFTAYHNWSNTSNLTDHKVIEDGVVSSDYFTVLRSLLSVLTFSNGKMSFGVNINGTWGGVSNGIFLSDGIREFDMIGRPLTK